MSSSASLRHHLQNLDLRWHSPIVPISLHLGPTSFAASAVWTDRIRHSDNKILVTGTIVGLVFWEGREQGRDREWLYIYIFLLDLLGSIFIVYSGGRWSNNPWVINEKLFVVQSLPTWHAATKAKWNTDYDSKKLKQNMRIHMSESRHTVYLSCSVTYDLVIRYILTFDVCLLYLKNIPHVCFLLQECSRSAFQVNLADTLLFLVEIRMSTNSGLI
jgi:hypothetical protein